MSNDSDFPGETAVPETSVFPNTAASYDEEEELQASNGGVTELSRDTALDGQTQPPTSAPQGRRSLRLSLPPLKEYFFGIRRWRPKRLQVLRNKLFFTFLLCCATFIEGALATGFTSVVLSSIERRYHFSSTVAGIIASCFDIAILISVLFISYFGGKGHKPRWLGASLVVMGIGAYVFAIPQFVLGSYDIGRDAALRFEECADSEDFSPDCTDANGVAIAFFIVGQLLIGVGAAPLFTIGISYLDEIVHPKHVSIHLGFFYALAVVGPALGFGLGGAFLFVYVDPWHSTTLEPSDPGWVGAWWLSFLFAGTVCILLSIPFFMFPRLLPDSHLIKQARSEEMAKAYRSKYGDKEENNFATEVKTLPTHIKLLCTNPVWVLITASIAFSSLIVSGMAAFLPKYWESQFHLTASSASLIAGVIGIPAGGIGALTGALIIYCFKAKGRRVVLINWIVTLLLVLAVFAFLVHCPTTELVGVKEPYPDGSKNRDLDSSCTLPCNCSSTVFEPVCGEDGFTYFSPCRAGCQKFPGTETFENCTCIAQRQVNDLGLNTSNTFLVEIFHGNSTASEGMCDVDCDGLTALFGVLSAVMVLLAFCLLVPNVLITVRCVAEQQRTFALGFQSMFLRLFGYIPGPVLFGVIFDLTCIHWQRKCGERGNCWVYDNNQLSVGSLIIALIGIFVNFVFTFSCWLVYPRKNEGTIASDGDAKQERRKDNRSQAKSNDFDRSLSKDMLLRSIDSTASRITLQVSPDSIEGVVTEDAGI